MAAQTALGGDAALIAAGNARWCALGAENDAETARAAREMGRERTARRAAASARRFGRASRRWAAKAALLTKTVMRSIAARAPGRPSRAAHHARDVFGHPHPAAARLQNLHRLT